jgi:hypothetical protein
LPENQGKYTRKSKETKISAQGKEKEFMRKMGKQWKICCGKSGKLLKNALTGKIKQEKGAN